MAVTHKYPKLAGRLFSASLAVAPALAIANDGQFPHQQRVCSPDAEGNWQCVSESATAGPYPQAPLAEIRRRKPKPAESDVVISSTVPAAPNNDWDWIAAEQLTEAQRCKKKSGCGGAYIEPTADWPESDQDPEQSPLRASSNDSEMVGEVLTVTGDVLISQGSRAVKADNASLNRSTSELTLSGNVEIREPGVLMRGSDALMNTDTGLGHIENARILQHDAGVRVTADLSNRPSEQIIELEQATYTQCTPDDELWRLSASEMELDNSTGWGSAKHAVLRVGNVPVFYSPYMTFPIDDRRKTGFLFPSFSSGTNGFDVSAPFYLNLAPNYDATITPRHIADRGDMLELETRYMNDWGHWQIAGADLAKDDIGYTDPQTGEVREHRWLGSVKHNGSFGSYWSTSIDYTKVSDDDYFRDLNIDSLDIQRATHLEQNGRLNFNSSQWTGSLLVSDFQTINNLYPEPYKRLPQFSLEYRNDNQNFRPNLILDTEFTSFDHDKSIKDGGSFVTGDRAWAESGITLPMRWTAGFIVPTAKVRHVSYDLNDPSTNIPDKTSSATVGVGTLDMGLFFERQLQFSNTGYTQTLEPRLFYFYSEYEEQNSNPIFDTSELTFSYSQLFRDTRFTGHDRLDDANQASAGLTSRFIDNESGRESLVLSLGQIFYFEDREVNAIDPRTGVAPVTNTTPTTSNSEIAAEIQYQPIDKLWFTTSALWDSRQDKMNESGVSLHHETEGEALYNLGYRYRRNGTNVAGLYRNLEQADASVVFPISTSWRVMGRYQYDIDTERSLEEMVALEYGDCCWLTRLVYQKAAKDELPDGMGGTELDYDYQVILQFQLKGLGNLGAQASSVLRESILGYKDRE